MGDGRGSTALSLRSSGGARRWKWISPYWVLWFSSSLLPLSDRYYSSVAAFPVIDGGQWKTTRFGDD